MTIGQRIKKRRLLLDMTVEELAAKLDKNRATVYRYENGDIENLPLEVLDPLAQALETTPSYIMGWNAENEYTENVIDAIMEEFTDKHLTVSENNRILGYVHSLVISDPYSVKQAREQKGISVETLARELGISAEQVEKYETGNSFPLKHLKKVRETLGVTYYDLLAKSKLYNPLYEDIFVLQLTDDELQELYDYGVYIKNKRKNT